MLNRSPSAHPISLLKFSGEDASNFLQGQLTNDVETLANNWHYNGYCSPKGRLLALFMMWRHNDELFALLPSSLVDPTVKRLRMYVMRSKVVIEIMEKICVSTYTPSSEPRFNYENAADLHTLSFGGRALSIATKVDNSNNTLPPEWITQNIKDGLPEITDKTTELFVPQMINLDLLAGINFKKGCYTGQEIVARMHYLGKLKQRMFVCSITGSTISADTSCQAGNKVMSTDKNIGHIVCSDGNLALAVLRTEFVEKKSTIEMTVETTDGKHVGLNINDTQPYSLELKA